MARKRCCLLSLFCICKKRNSREHAKERATSSKEEGRSGQLLNTGARAAGTVSAFSDALPPLKITADILKVILENASTMVENRTEAQTLFIRIQRLQEMLGSNISDTANIHAISFKGELDRIIKKLEPLCEQTDESQRFPARCARFLCAQEHKSRLQDFVASVERALSHYMSAAITDLHREMLRSIKREEQETLDKLNPVSEAMYNADDGRASCLPGTRIAILSELEGWAGSMTTKRVYWLNGHAGSGKSTTAQSLAERLFEKGKLGASFFCLRNTDRRSNSKSIFPTLAFQLARTANEQSAAYRKALLQILATEANPDVATYSLSKQLMTLILQPATQSGIETVILIDALDECVDEGSTSAILYALSEHATRLSESKLKFFITSRPEPHIRSGFRLGSLEELTDAMAIQYATSASTDQDIRLFLEHHLRQIATRSDFNISEVWPTPTEVNALVSASAGLFIFASTIIKFLDNARGDPRARLRAVFDFENAPDRTGDTQTPSHPFSDLDRLYSTILKDAQPDSVLELKDTLAFIILACIPHSITTLAELLGLSEGDIRTRIRSLHSVLLVPTKSTDPLRPHHKSFSDFLVDPRRCKDENLFVAKEEYHRKIAVSCLEYMQRSLEGTSHNVMGWSADSHFGEEPTLQYCSRYWATHLSSTMGGLYPYFIPPGHSTPSKLKDSPPDLLIMPYQQPYRAADEAYVETFTFTVHGRHGVRLDQGIVDPQLDKPDEALFPNNMPVNYLIQFPGYSPAWKDRFMPTLLRIAYEHQPSLMIAYEHQPSLIPDKPARLNNRAGLVKEVARRMERFISAQSLRGSRNNPLCFGPGGIELVDLYLLELRRVTNLTYQFIFALRKDRIEWERDPNEACGSVFASHISNILGYIKAKHAHERAPPMG